MLEAMKSDVQALQLISRFAITPNSRKLCGPNDGPAILSDCIAKGRTEGVKEALTGFRTLYPYLQTISEVAGLDQFSYEVGEAYWLGNDVLKIFKPSDNQIFLKHFYEKEIKSNQLEVADIKLINNSEKRFIPFHLARVIGSSDSSENNIDYKNDCMIRWGSVKSIEEKKAEVELSSLEDTFKGYKLTKLTETVEYDPSFVENLKEGSIVAVHWRFIAKVLTDKEKNNLAFWTEKTIESLKY